MHAFLPCSSFPDDLGKWYADEEKDEALRLTPAELAAFYLKLQADFPMIVTIEDPFDQDDWGGWADFAKALQGTGTQLVADDLTVTNVARIRRVGAFVHLLID